MQCLCLFLSIYSILLNNVSPSKWPYVLGSSDACTLALAHVILLKRVLRQWHTHKEGHSYHTFHLEIKPVVRCRRKW